VDNTAAVTFFGAGTMDASPPVGPVVPDMILPDPEITAITPTSVAEDAPFVLRLSGVGFTRRHTPLQVRIETNILTIPVDLGFSDSLMSFTFPAGLTPPASYDVFVDFSDGTELEAPAQIIVT
jgi:hypothetical protein